MGTVVQILEAPAGYNVGSVTAELYVPTGTTQPPVWAFTNPGTNLAIMFPTRAINYGGGSMVVDVDWYSTAGSTTGTVTWKVAVTSIAAGAAESIEAATGGTAGTSASTVNGTAKGLTRATITITSGNLDGIATGSDIWLNVQRDTSDTSMAGTAALKSITISYGDGLAGTPGSGDVVGPGSSTNNDIAAFDLTTGKLIKDSGVLVTSVVVGPASATSGRVAVYNGTTGKLVQDGTKLEADLVTGPASVTSARVAVFNGTTGKIIADSGIASGVVVLGPNPGSTGVIAAFTGSGTTITDSSGKLAADLVTGPASVTTGRVASFNGTTGKIIQQGTQLAADLVSGPASASAGNIAALDATGKILSDSGVSATAHAARHQVGGADSLFSGTFATSDTVQWNGSVWVPRFMETVELSATAGIASGAGTLADVTGLTVSLPRAGTYRFACRGAIVSSGTAGHFFSAMNYTGTVTRINAGGTYYLSGTATGFMYLTQIANNALASTTGAGTATNGTQSMVLDGLIVVSTTGTLSWRFARASASTTATIQTASGFTVWET